MQAPLTAPVDREVNGYIQEYFESIHPLEESLLDKYSLPHAPG
jgi:hypothetical protein